MTWSVEMVESTYGLKTVLIKIVLFAMEILDGFRAAQTAMKEACGSDA